MGGARTWLTLSVMIVAALAGAAGDDAWERRVDLETPVPMQLPELPSGNPFAVAVATPPQVQSTSLLEKFDTTVSVPVAVYIDREGECKRAVPLADPLPGIGRQTATELTGEKTGPATSLGSAVPVWRTLRIRMEGRIKEGSLSGMAISPVEEGPPPVADVVEPPEPTAMDLQLPDTPDDLVDRQPDVARWNAKAKLDEIRGRVRLLAEVDDTGRATRVVFLSGPEGLQPWLLRSMRGWRFSPATGVAGEPLASWALMDFAVTAETGSWRSQSVGVDPELAYP